MERETSELYIILTKPRASLDADPEEELRGIVFGPIRGIMGVFNSEIKLDFTDRYDSCVGDSSFPTLYFVGDCLHYGGWFYSDFLVGIFSRDDIELHSSYQKFDQEKADNPY